MPELPEVETVRRGIEPKLAGKRIIKIIQNRPDLRIPFPENMPLRLEGRTCLYLRRRGKYILIDLDSAETLVIHLGMSGSFTINPVSPRLHDHFIIETDDGNRLVYNDPRRFGMVFMIETDAENNHKAFKNMGAEPLGNDFNAGYLLQKLKGRKTSVKTTLLDQSVVAGIGNIYACEALYMAGICPLRQSGSIGKAYAETLVTAIRTVLQHPIEAGGSTLRDHRLADGTLGYFQHRFKVYGRDKEICPDTGDKIKKIIQAGRSTFYCAAKQR